MAAIYRISLICFFIAIGFFVSSCVYRIKDDKYNGGCDYEISDDELKLKFRNLMSVNAVDEDLISDKNGDFNIHKKNHNYYVLFVLKNNDMVASVFDVCGELVLFDFIEGKR